MQTNLDHVVKLGSGTGRCPVDGAALRTSAHGSDYVEACPLCHGLWLPAERWRWLCHAARRPVAAPEFPSEKRMPASQLCPTCPRSLLTRRQAGAVEIDQCSQCGGVWLDHGEIDRILNLSRAGTIGPLVKRTENSNGVKGMVSDVTAETFVHGVGEVMGMTFEAGLELIGAIIGGLGDGL